MAENRISWAECLVVGVVGFGVVGIGAFLALLAGFVAYVRGDGNVWDDWNASFILSAAAAAATVGTFAWRTVVRVKDASRWKGALAGAFVGIMAHPVGWMIMGSLAVASDHNLWGVGSAGSVILMGTVLGTFSTLVGLGWITTPLGALLGALIVDVRAQVYRKAFRATDAQMPPG